LNGKDKEQKKVCLDLKEKNLPIVQDGIDGLNKALQLRPDYDDAMAYMTCSTANERTLNVTTRRRERPT
jgi:hypothetical protein